MESSVLAGRPHYHGSGSFSTEWMKRHKLEEMRNERDQLREELAKTNKVVEHQYELIKQMMATMNFQPIQHSRDQANEEDQANDNELYDDDEVEDDEVDGDLDLEAQSLPE
jgi:isopentenyl phosphate kinase